MSDGTKSRPSRGPQTRTRSKRGPRGGRHWQSRPAVTGDVAAIEEIEEIVVVEPATRRSRRVATTATTAATLPRETEFAYIRADLRRLIVIAAGLFALMLIILIVVERS